MTTVAHSPKMVQALTDALAIGLGKYPDESDRLLRGFALALGGHVELHEGEAHIVRSGTDADTVYAVNGQCTCPDYKKAPDGRCKHRFAAALAKRARDLMVPGFPPEPNKYYATFQVPGGEPVPGICVEMDDALYFIPDHAPEQGCWVGAREVTLGGDVALAQAQREADGVLVQAVCDSKKVCARAQAGYYKNGK